MSAVEITIRGYTTQQLLDQVTAAVREDASGRINEAVRGAIKDTVDSAIESLVDEAIKAEFAAVLAEGWQPTDSYGTPRGPKVSLRDRVAESIKNHLDGREYGRQTRVEKMVEDAVGKALAGDVGAELARAKAAIREQVDSLINSKLRETIAQALGAR